MPSANTADIIQSLAWHACGPNITTEKAPSVSSDLDVVDVFCTYLAIKIIIFLTMITLFMKLASTEMKGSVLPLVVMVICYVIACIVY